MAAKKEISGFIKLQIKGGQANPAPPVGPALGWITRTWKKYSCINNKKTS